MADQPVVLELAGIFADDDQGLPAVEAVNLKVHAGEIVGIAGVSGNGQSELVEVLSGQREPTRSARSSSTARTSSRSATRWTASRCSACRRSRSGTPPCRA